MRIHEFTRNDLRKSRATLQELPSQIQEMQDRMNYMNNSREFQDVKSICSGKLSRVPSQAVIVPSLCGMLSRDQVCDLIQGICLVHRVTFLTVHVQ